VCVPAELAARATRIPKSASSLGMSAKVDIEPDDVEEGSNTSVTMFLQNNTSREGITKVRDGKCGFMMWVDAAIFGFLLFSPCLALIPEMEQPVIVLVLWVIIGLIMWSKIEYNHRIAVWYICLNRGIIVDFPKTHKPKGWLLQLPTLFALTFLICVGIVIYVGLDPGFTFSDTDYIIAACLAIVGVAFVLLLTKQFVDLEGANLLSVNMMAHFLADDQILQDKGFKVVHLVDLQNFMIQKKSNKDDAFSWNEIHELRRKPEPGKPKGCPLLAGTKLFYYLKTHKDLES